MKPTIGRIVHYRSHGSADGVYEPECRAAIVTESYGDGVTLPEGRAWKASLAVFNPEGIFLKQDVLQDEKKSRGGTWHWPERDPEANKEAMDEALKMAKEMGQNEEILGNFSKLFSSMDKVRDTEQAKLTERLTKDGE